MIEIIMAFALVCTVLGWWGICRHQRKQDTQMVNLEYRIWKLETKLEEKGGTKP